VEARFLVPADHGALGPLREAGLVGEDATDDVEVTVARAVAADGRGSVRINGRIATGSALAEFVSRLVEIAGQREHARIASGGVQRALLDAYAGEACRDLAAEVAETVAEAAVAERNVENLSADERARNREIDALGEEIEEIEGAAVEEGEWDRLSGDAARLEHAESVASSIGRAVEALRGEGAAEELVAAAAREVGSLGDRDPASAPLAERLEAAAYDLGDIAQELTARVVAPDPEALGAVRARLDALARLRRRFGADEAEVIAHLEAGRERLRALEESDVDRDRWARRRDELGARARSAAERLRAMREAAAARLEQDVSRVLADLALTDARFEVRLEPRTLYEGGTETASFLVALNPGEGMRPLARVASGGELARIALALHLVTAGEGAATMVFDEVDAGVGGATAQAVGRCLARLARRSRAQVLVVTHLPQVAAFADAHLKVTKRTEAGRTTALVHSVEGDERIEELSRMLAGLPESERARGHAQELLELAAAG
jgi:DNA repair protein RecN (Recombination protein N)